MEAVILSIGSELTSGAAVDTNAAWLSGELTRLGLSVVEHVTVPDDLERIADAVKHGAARAGYVIITGGLGPTPDDVTREAVAAALDQPLDEDHEALRQIEAFFADAGRAMHPDNRRQSMVPRGAAVIPNENGTAPGFQCSIGPSRLFALPGVPDEMRAMFRSAVEPALRAVAEPTRAVRRRLNCFGVSEAEIGRRLGDMMARGRNPQIGTAASRGVISILILSRAAGEPEADALADREVERVRERLGRAVFGSGDETLESVVGGLLRRHDRTLAIAESCTGGLLSKRLTDVPGSSAYFLRAYVTYADRAKIEDLRVDPALLSDHGSVSEAVAGAMASGCRTIAQSDYALSITGIAGPTGGRPPDKPVGLVFIGLADAESVKVTSVRFGAHLGRNGIRDRACSVALNLLRLRLISVNRD